jgi:hypothetical protein
MTTTTETPVFYPTIVRRVHQGGLETMSRTFEGQEALCVFWSIEHAERDMDAGGFSPAEGWKAIERDHEELAQVFDLLRKIGRPSLVYLEPAPDAPELYGVFEPETFVGMLEASQDEQGRD